MFDSGPMTENCNLKGLPFTKLRFLGLTYFQSLIFITEFNGKNQNFLLYVVEIQFSN